MDNPNIHDYRSMPTDTFTTDWLQILDSVEHNRLERMSEIASQHAADFATAFYDNLITDPLAKNYLSHEQVKSRLHASLQGWIRQMCDPNSRHTVQKIFAHQTKIGEIHARTGVPVSLVLKGARLLKSEFSRYAAQTDEPIEQQLLCIRVFGLLMDLSMEAMSEAYASSIDQKTRSSEAYRLFSLTENVATERERQRAALLDWQSRLMFETAVATDNCRLPKVTESEFGLWFRHKGMYAFQGSTEVELITNCMHQIDDGCLPRFTNLALGAPERFELIHQMRALADSILTQMNTLFAKSLEVESGKDVMTGLLNRRFLPSILAREIEFCRQNNKSFSIASIDVDHFKTINDNYGHEAGDAVLVDIANLIVSRSRGGDFVFRMGGEEFLLVLVDTIPEYAHNLVERLRTSIANNEFVLPNQTRIKATASIGLTSYNGHPDYQYLLRKVDRALYQAKSQGRNQVYVAD